MNNLSGLGSPDLLFGKIIEDNNCPSGNIQGKLKEFESNIVTGEVQDISDSEIFFCRNEACRVLEFVSKRDKDNV